MDVSAGGHDAERISDRLTEMVVEPALDRGVPTRVIAQLLGAIAGFACLRTAMDALALNDPEYGALPNPIVTVGLADGTQLLSGDAINRPLLEASDSFAARLADALRDSRASAPDIEAVVRRKASEIGDAAFWTTPDLPPGSPLAQEALERVRPWLPILAEGRVGVGPHAVALSVRVLLEREPDRPIEETAALGRIALETAVVTAKFDPSASWEPEIDRRLRFSSEMLGDGRADSALVELDPLLALRPNDPTMVAVVARAALAAGDRERAVALGVEAGRLGTVGAAKELLAVVRAGLDAPAWAGAARAASRRAPDDWRAHAVVVEADLDAGDVHDGTMTHVAAMFRIAPEETRVQTLAGRVALARHRPAEARKRFLEALESNPADAEVQERLAELDARRFRYRTAARTVDARREADPKDGLADRLTDGLVTRLVVAPVLGPAAVAALLWYATRERSSAPADWSSRTVATDMPWLAAAPLLIAVIAVVQAVLLHRATGGGIWRTVREYRGRRLLAVAAILGAGTFALVLASLTLPFAEARPLLLAAAVATAVLLAGAVFTGAALSRRLQRRGQASGPAARRVADWTGVEPTTVPARPDAPVLLGAFLTLPVALPMLMLLIAVGVSRMNGPADLDPTTSIALERPWLLPSILLEVVLVVLAGTRASRAGAPVGRALRQRPGVLALTYGVVLTAATIAAVVAPLWTGQRLVLLLVVPHVLAVLIGGPIFLLRTQARRQRRRHA